MKTRSKKKAKYYLVVDTSRGYMHGAFPFTEEGLEKARKFIESSKKKTEEELIIKPDPLIEHV